jgi:hypothetical protein
MRLLPAKDLFKFESFELIAPSFQQNAHGYKLATQAFSPIYQIDFAIIVLQQ